MNLHLLVGPIVLLPNVILQARIICFVFLLQHIYVENIVPQEMILVCMLVKVLSLLLKALTADVADVTFVFLVLLQIISSFSEGAEGVNHESTNNISEEHLKESEVDDIVDESHDFKLLHSLANNSRDIELYDAAHDVVAHILDLVGCGVEVLHVVAEGDGAEDKAEEHSHNAYKHYLVPVVYHAQEDSAKLVNLSEDIDQVQEEEGREVECPQDRRQQKYRDSPKLDVFVYPLLLCFAFLFYNLKYANHFCLCLPVVCLSQFNFGQLLIRVFILGLLDGRFLNGGFLLNFGLASADGLRIKPKFELKPIEYIQYGKGQLEEAQNESNQPYAKLRVKLSLLIFDYDVVEEGNVKADDDGEV